VSFNRSSARRDAAARRPDHARCVAALALDIAARVRSFIQNPIDGLDQACPFQGEQK
jgi:hypothetical protein